MVVIPVYDNYFGLKIKIIFFKAFSITFIDLENISVNTWRKFPITFMYGSTPDPPPHRKHTCMHRLQ